MCLRLCRPSRWRLSVILCAAAAANAESARYVELGFLGEVTNVSMFVEARVGALGLAEVGKSFSESDAPSKEVKIKPKDCFCLYTGGCKEKFTKQCGSLNQPTQLTGCQVKVCKMKTINQTAVASSFKNLKDDGDILSIPNTFYKHIDELKSKSADPLAVLTDILDTGRQTFYLVQNKFPQWQCFNIPSRITVPWFHVHSFCGRVNGEGLPRNGICAKVADISTADAAAFMLATPTNAAELKKFKEDLANGKAPHMKAPPGHGQPGNAQPGNGQPGNGQPEKADDGWSYWLNLSGDFWGGDSSSSRTASKPLLSSKAEAPQKASSPSQGGVFSGSSEGWSSWFGGKETR